VTGPALPVSRRKPTVDESGLSYRLTSGRPGRLVPFLFWRRGIDCHLSITAFDTKPFTLGVMMIVTRRASSVIARATSPSRATERALPLTIDAAAKLVEQIESSPHPGRESAVHSATGVVCTAPWATHEERDQAQGLVARLFRLQHAADGRLTPEGR